MTLWTEMWRYFPEIAEIGIKSRWVIYGKKKRYAITANEIVMFTYPKTGKLQLSACYAFDAPILYVVRKFNVVSSNFIQKELQHTI